MQTIWPRYSGIEAAFCVEVYKGKSAKFATFMASILNNVSTCSLWATAIIPFLSVAAEVLGSGREELPMSRQLNM